MPGPNCSFGSEATCLLGDSGRAVEWAWSRIEWSLRLSVRRITENSDDQQDLLQEALVELWVIDPTRFDLRDRDNLEYLRRMLVNRMWDVWRSEMSRMPLAGGLTG